MSLILNMVKKPSVSKSYWQTHCANVSPEARYFATAFSVFTIGSYKLPGTTCPKIWNNPVAPDGLYASVRPPDSHSAMDRSEERREGKECRSRWSPYQQKKNRGLRLSAALGARQSPAALRRLHGARAPYGVCFFFSSRRRHTSSTRDWSSDVCSSD